MKNHLTKSLLLLAVLFAAIPVSAYDFSEENEDGKTIYYNVISEEDKTCEVTAKEIRNIISSTPYDDYVGDINFPSTAKGYQVIRIGNRACYNCKSMTSVNIPNSVTSIEYDAFRGCSGLLSVNIPNSVTTLDRAVFNDCEKLPSITIPQSITTIPGFTFSGCKAFTSITIPNTVTTIGDYAFQVCDGLTSVTIPSSVTRIDNSAFSTCRNLEEIIVEEGNPTYNSANNCNAIINTKSNTLIVGCKGTVIPNTVTTIGGHAFRGCSGLTSITIPNSVTTIEWYAFWGCI